MNCVHGTILPNCAMGTYNYSTSVISLRNFVDNRVLSSTMAKKILGRCFNFHHLDIVHKRFMFCLLR